MPRRSRRPDICEAAVALAAKGGSHTLTHQGIDAYLGIARGSTSYYFRTRAELIAAVADHIAAQSREIFTALLAKVPDGQADSHSEVIEQYMRVLLGERRAACRARMALLLDADCGDAQRRALADCLFSREAAIALFDDGRDDPAAAATALIDSLEGALVRHTIFAVDGAGGPIPAR